MAILHRSAALFLALLLALLLVSCAGRVRGPLAQEAFVWQRAWTPDVRAAVASRAGLPLSGLVVLAAELSWNGGPTVTTIAIDRAASSALAIRIEAPPSWDDPRPLVAVAAQVVKRHAPRELLLDLDAPEAHLADYARWIDAVRHGVPGVTLTITALPAWLAREDGFRRLVRATDGFVLQVHSLEPPRGPGEPVVLCDPARARGWVERAARAGVPFRVALPAYGYRARFDGAGRLRGLSADGAPDGGADEVIANPAAMAGLVRAWTADRPRNMHGIVWFRLPVGGAELNWSRATLAEVMAGRVPATARRVVIRLAEPALVEIDLVNDGAADARAARATLAWGEGTLLAADGLGGFAPAGATRRSTALVAVPARLVRPGEKLTIGWFRFTTPPAGLMATTD